MTAYNIDVGYKKQHFICSCCGIKLKSNSRTCPKCHCNMRNESDVVKDGNPEEMAHFTCLMMVGKMLKLIGAMEKTDNG